MHGIITSLKNAPAPRSKARIRRRGDGRHLIRIGFDRLETRRLLATLPPVAEFPLRQSGGSPVGVTEDASGNAWVLLANGNIAEFNQNGTRVFPPPDPPTYTGYMNQYPVPTFDGLASAPAGSALGLITYDTADKDIWFYEASTNPNSNRLAMLDPSTGAITEYPLLAFTQDPVIDQIIAGPDGNIYFTEPQLNDIGMFDIQTGLVSQFPMPVADTQPQGITVGGDGNLWFTEGGQNKIGSLNPVTHVINNYAFEAANYNNNDLAEGITAGPNDTIWFVENQNNRILGFNIATQTFGAPITPYYPPPVPSPVPFANLWSIAEGTDGNIYYTEPAFGWVGVIANPTSAGGGTSERVYNDSEQQPNLTNALIAPGVAGTNVFITGPAASDIYVMDTASLSTGYFYMNMPGVVPANDANGIVSVGDDLWFTDSTDHLGQVALFNPTTQINTDYALPPIAGVNPGNYDPNQMTVDSNGNIWFTDTSVNAIGELDPGTGSISQTVLTSTSSQPVGITWDPYDVTQGQFWMTEPTANKVVSFNPATSGSAVAPIPGLTDPVDILADPSTGDLWITEGSARQIIDYDPSNEQVLYSFTTQGNPNQLIWGPDGKIWFSESGYVGVLNPPTGQGTGGIAGEIPISGTAGALAAGPAGGAYASTLWFTIPGTAQIGEINVTSQTLVGYVTAPDSNGLSIALGPDGNEWFTSGSGNPSWMGAVVLNPNDLGANVVITTQPSNTQATVFSGLVYGFGLVVSVENSAGQVDPFVQQGSITIQTDSDPNGGKLTGTLTLPVSDGMAIFDGLTVNTPGQGYTIQATYSLGLNAPVSNPFTVSGTPTQLTITAEPPSSVGAGVGFGVTVSAVNANGYVVPTFVDPISLAIQTNPPGNGVLQGVDPLGALYGSSAFADLSIDQEGNGYTLQATDLNSGANLSSATSAAFDVIAGPAAQLVFDPDGEPAATALAGQNLAGSGPILVDAEDRFGQIDRSFDGAITLALANGATGQLVGTLTENAVNGVATFTQVAIQTVGTFELVATGSKVTAATSSSITISPAAPDRLIWATEPPSTVTQGVPFAARLDIVDQYGNLETGDNQGVTLSLALNGSSDATDLGGTTSANASGGVVNFGGIVINAVGTTFTLSAASGEVDSSASSTIDAVAPTLVVTTEPPSTVTTGIGYTVVVTVETNLGTPDTAYTGSVGLSIKSGPQGGALGGSTSAAVSSGVATISNLQFDVAGTYVLAATSGALAAVDSNSVVAVAPTLVVTTEPPSTVTTGVGYTVVVTVETNLGTPDTAYTGSVGLSIKSGPQGGALGGSTSAAVSSGVATISNLQFDVAGTYVLAAASGSLAPVDTSSIVAVAPTLVVTTEPPATVDAGADFNIVVTVETNLGTPDTAYTGSVGLSINSGPQGGAIGGNSSATVSAGVATIDGVQLEVAGSYVLAAASDSLATVDTNSITVNANSSGGEFYIIEQPPSSVVAGAGFGLEVGAEDAYGNKLTISGQVTVGFGNNPGGSTLGGTTTLAVNGLVATFSGLTLNRVGSDYTLQVTGASQQPVTTSDISVTAGSATRLVIPAADEPPASVQAGQTFSLSVIGEDTYGNPAPITGSVQLALSSDPSGTTLVGTTTVSASGGTATFTGLSLDLVGTGYLITASTTSPSPTLVSTTSTRFNVTPAAATQLSIPSADQPPTSVEAGQTFSLSVIGEDTYGNPAPITGPVQLALSSDPSGTTLLGTTTVTASGGTATFSDLSLDLVGTGYTITATDKPLAAATSGQIQVTPAGAVALTLLPAGEPPASVEANQPFSMTVAALDQYGNVASLTGNVVVSLANNPENATLGGTKIITASKGAATFANLSLNIVGTGYTLTVNSPSLGSSVTTSAIQVTAAVATQLVIPGAGEPPGNVTAGAAFGLTVDAEDPSGNVDSSYQGPVTITSPSAVSGTTSVDAVNGVATFTDLIITQAGTYQLQVGSGSLKPATSAQLTVNADAQHPTSLSWSEPPPAQIQRDASFPVMVNVVDEYGNIEQGYQGNMSLKIDTNPGGAALVGTTSVPVANGTASFSGLSISAVGNGYTLVASSGNLTSSDSPAIIVTPIPAAGLQLSLQPPLSVEDTQSFSLAVTAEDRNGVADPDFTGSVTVSVLTPAGSDALGGVTTVDAIAGVATFSGLTITTLGTYVLQISSNGLTPTTTGDITITAGQASQLGVSTQPPTSTTAGGTFGFSVQAEDPFGHASTSFTGVVYAQLVSTLAGAVLDGPLTAVVTNGVATFSNLSMDLAGAGFTIEVSGIGLNSATTNSFSIAPSYAVSLVVTTSPPATVSAGSPFGVTVVAQDTYGNTATSFVSPVSLGLTVKQPGVLGGTLSAVANSGVATFPAVSLDVVGSNYLLQATSLGVKDTTSTYVRVVPAAASMLYVTAQPPSNMAAGTQFGFVVEVLDPYGNLVNTFGGAVSVSVVGPSGPVSLASGPASVTATSGIADFPPTLAIDRAGTGLTIQVTSPGLAPVSTAPITITGLTSTHLAVTVEPPSSVGPGSPFGFVVAAEDQYGNVAPGYNGPITIALPPGSSSRLGGTTTVEAVDGLASFQGLTLAGSTNPVSIQATASGLPGTSTTPVGLTTPTSLTSSGGSLVSVTRIQVLKQKVKRKQITEIVLGFSGALDAATANDTADYQLVVAGKKNSFTARNARRLSFLSATYNPAANTVTLLPQKKLPARLMQLTVVGQPPSGIEDSSGRPIAGGGSGQAGGNTVAVVKRTSVTITAAVDLALEGANFEGNSRKPR